MHTIVKRDIPPLTPMGQVRREGTKRARLAAMTVGQWITVQADDEYTWSSWRTTASVMGRELDRQYSTRRSGNVLEIWRVR